MPDPDQRPDEHPIEFDVEPTVAGRVARWAERAQVAKGRVEQARSRHSSIDLGFVLVERDSQIAGALLSGALAYRLFVLLLPSALIFVSGIGLYADTVDKSTSTVAREAGLHGLIASQVASTAAGSARWLVFIVFIPVALYATVKLYRAIAIMHAIVWYQSGRGVRVTRNGVVVFIFGLLLNLAAAELIGWIRRTDQVSGAWALLVYLVIIGGAWLAVSTQLPHGTVRWTALIPGAVLVGIGALFINVFNIYVTTRLVEDRADTYGALGIAAAVLFSLVLVGRLMVVSAELNALLADRRAGNAGSGEPRV